MKTIVIILVTLVISQQIYRSYGPNNVITRATDSCVKSVRSMFQSADHVRK